MPEKWRVSWSGGKDSTAALFLHLTKTDHQVHAVCFVPMLTEKIPLIMPNHYDFILKTAEHFKSMGAEISIVHGETYYQHTHRTITKGKHKGMKMGIGLGFGFCLFRDYQKIRNGICSVKFDYDFEDVGIAADEKKRLSQLTGIKRSILYEYGITERGAFEICAQNKILSPHYMSANNRDGCAICPNGKPNEFLKYIAAYPEAVPVLLEIEEFCKKERPGNAPYRNYQWFSDRMKCGMQYEFEF